MRAGGGYLVGGWLARSTVRQLRAIVGSRWVVLRSARVAQLAPCSRSPRQRKRVGPQLDGEPWVRVRGYATRRIYDETDTRLDRHA